MASIKTPKTTAPATETPEELRRTLQQAHVLTECTREFLQRLECNEAAIRAQLRAVAA
jgi:hypothetical protein